MNEEPKPIIPTNAVLDPDRLRGVYSKYQITRLNDPAKKHADCEYWVLDLVHDEYAYPCLELYAKLCQPKFPHLAMDIQKMLVMLRNRMG